jgi:hypothetical protein
VRDEPDDAALEEQLREIAQRIDPVPDWLLAAAIDSYAWRTIDSDLAELVFDSEAEEAGALVRGGDRTRLLSFEATGMTIDVQVGGSGTGRRIIGQLAPPRRATVQIRQGRGGADLETDDLGRFSGPLEDGPFSLLCTAGTEGTCVVTDWIAI